MTRPESFVTRVMGVGIAVFLFLNAPARAQFTGDSQTNIISGIVSNWSGTYYVGDGYAFDQLQAVNSGHLSVTYDLVIGAYGYGSTVNSMVVSNGGNVTDLSGWVGFNADNNSALVTGSGSVWSNQSDLYIGNGSVSGIGSGNSLVINNGGKVSNQGSLQIGVGGSGNSLVIDSGGKLVNFTGSGYIGVNNGFNADNNTVLVTGNGSAWNNQSDLYIGFGTGAGNSLVISNGGAVVDATGSCYIGFNATSNSVLITGGGSVWSNANLLNVGYSGSANSLVVSNGGVVINGIGFVGYYSGSSNNSVRIVDGAVWQNGTLDVGEQGSGNSLVVDGGSVLAENLTIGVASAGCDNLVELDSGSVFVTNASADAVLDVRNGMFILNGGLLRVDTFVYTNPCAQFTRNGGTFLCNQLVLDPNTSLVGDGIPNWWKQQYHLDPFDPNLANEDADGDGFTNLQEFQTGTDPTNSASAFRITSLVRTGNDVLVTWTMGNGKTNALQATTGDPSGSYTNDFADIFTVTNTIGTVTNYTDSGGMTNTPSHYYRVRLVP